MNFPWSRERKRRELLAAPFPSEWREWINQDAAYYAALTAAERETLESVTRLLLAEKNWEGIGDIEVTQRMQVTVAAQAAVLVLERDYDDYAHVESILLYPAVYSTPQRTIEPGLVVTESLVPTEGTASAWGTVALDWPDTKAGGLRQAGGRNVVFHEFAHQLDMHDGTADGVPQLDSDAQRDEWSSVMSSEYQLLKVDLEAGHPSFLDAYAATNGAEFFAVATEYFFEQGPAMLHARPQLYHALQGYYRQDPAQRVLGHILR